MGGKRLFKKKLEEKIKIKKRRGVFSPPFFIFFSPLLGSDRQGKSSHSRGVIYFFKFLP
jgi:hypothetical protein